MVIFPLAPDQTIAQMWTNGARGGCIWVAWGPLGSSSLARVFSGNPLAPDQTIAQMWTSGAWGIWTHVDLYSHNLSQLSTVLFRGFSYRSSDFKSSSSYTFNSNTSNNIVHSSVVDIVAFSRPYSFMVWLIEQCLTSLPTQYRLLGDSFTGPKTQPTVSNYWRKNSNSTKKRYKSKENLEKANNTKYSNTTKRHIQKKQKIPYSTIILWGD